MSFSPSKKLEREIGSNNPFNSKLGALNGLITGSGISFITFLIFFQISEKDLVSFLLMKEGFIVVIFCLVLILTLAGGGWRGGLIKDIVILLTILLSFSNFIALMILFQPTGYYMTWIISSFFSLAPLSTLHVVTRYGSIPFRTDISYVLVIWSFLITFDAFLLSLVSFEIWILATFIETSALILTINSEKFEFSLFTDYLTKKMVEEEEKIILYDVPNLSVMRFMRKYYLSKIVVQLNRKLQKSYILEYDAKMGFFLTKSQISLETKQNTKKHNKKTISRRKTRREREIELQEKVVTLIFCITLFILIFVIIFMIYKAFTTGAFEDPKRIVKYLHTLYWGLNVVIVAVFSISFSISVREKGLNG